MTNDRFVQTLELMMSEPASKFCPYNGQNCKDCNTKVCYTKMAEYLEQRGFGDIREKTKDN